MKVRKMLLREETEKVLHTKSNGDKLVVAPSGDGYTAFTRDNVRIGHISADTDAAAVAEFSKKEPKYEALDMSLEELQRTADRYLDVEIDELMRTILEKTSNMDREQLSRLVRLCRNFYALLEEFASNSITESYMDTHEGVAHVDTLDLMAALKSVVKEYGHMELVTPLYCELHDDEHGRRLELNRAVDEGLVPDKIVPDKIGGDINLNLDGSHSSVGFLGGTATNTNNGEEGDHDASNAHNEDLDEAALTEKGPKINKKAAAKALADKVDDAATPEDKARMMKKIIERVPTDKVENLANDIKSMLPDRGLTEEDKEILKKKTNIDPKLIEGADSVMTLIDNVLDGVQLGLPVLGALIDILHFAIPDELAAAACPPVAAILAILSYIPDGFVVSILLDFGITALRGIGTLAKNVAMTGVKALPDKEETTEDLDDDFMDAEKMDMSEFDSHQGKLEDIEFVMTEYIADSMLIEFVKKVDATTWLVGVEDEVVTVKFDPSWSEYVYTIEGRGPYSHSSYEYISRDVYDFVMANRTDNSADLDEDYGNDEMTEFLNWIQDYNGGCLWDAFTTEFNTDKDPDIDDVLKWLEDFNNDAYYAYIEKDEYDDDYDDLSSFRECSEVKRADTLYGVEERDELVEAVYTDTSGIMGVAGETYTTAELRKIWNDNHNDDPSMVKYNGDYDKWVSDTLAQMSRNDDVDEAFDMSRGPDLSNLSWQVASHLDVDALGEDKWIEFICDDPRDTTGGKKSMRFEAIGEDAHMYGFIRTNGDAVDVQFRNGSEAVCHSAEEVARFIAGEFGISI